MGSVSTNVGTNACTKKFLMVGKCGSGKSSIIKIIAPNFKFPVQNIKLNSNICYLMSYFLFGNYHSDHFQMFCKDITGLIFVLDSSCIYADVKYYLDLFMKQQEVQKSKILILANKCDLENAMTKDQIYEELNLESYKGQLLLQMCSTITKQGIKEGIKWLTG
ncbi:ADP-ribosylation_factor [Hexamita inflata]|uniref:ADP-ribosylation_factor n=1 Tax=Hexamita inflata TaxID=28002 RepID=A0ABP1KPU9_9EUKA